MRVTRALHERGLTLPRSRPLGEVLWRSPTIAAVTAILKNPAYIGWDSFEKIQAMLHDNCAVPVCQRLYAAAIDECVAAAFLEAVAPAEIDAWNAARRSEAEAVSAWRQGEEQQIERLRYQATLAERQFNRVDPDNRLVAAELERRWEVALIALREAEAALAQRNARAHKVEPAQIGPELRRQALAVGERLPALWANPAVSREHRKALLRCLIDKVILRRAGRDAAQIRIVWRGGAISEMQVALPVNALAALPRGAEMEARVVELAKAGVPDSEIIRTLTEEGHRSTRRDRRIRPTTVQAIRLRHGIKAVWRCTRWPRVPGWLTVTEIAERLGLPQHWLQKRLRSGAIHTLVEPSGRRLFPDKPETMEALRQLRAGAIDRVDLTTGIHHKKGHHYA